MLALIVLRRRRPAASGLDTDLSAEERARLDQLLKNSVHKSSAEQSSADHTKADR
ncbi:hypothetical protein D3C78_1934270 [compost metagenome]